MKRYVCVLFVCMVRAMCCAQEHGTASARSNATIRDASEVGGSVADDGAEIASNIDFADSSVNSADVGDGVFMEAASESAAVADGGDSNAFDARDGSSASGAVITEIRVNGLKKTRQSHMQTLLKKYRDIPTDRLDLHDVETTLQQIGLFSESDVELRQSDDGNAVLVITVTEKLSFIPLPFVAVMDGKFMGGGVIMDTNAFGVQQAFIVGGIFSSTTMMGIATYAKPSMGLTKPGFSVSGSGRKSHADVVTMDGDTVLKYDAIGFNARFALSDQLTEHSSASASVSYSQNAIDHDDGYDYVAADSYKAVAVDASWRLSVADWNGWFLSSKGVEVGGGIRFYQNGDRAPAAAIHVDVEQPLFTPRLRFIGRAGGNWRHNDHISQLDGGSAVGVVILPDDFRSARLAGASGGFEFAFAKTRQMLFSVYANYQAVCAEDSDARLRLTHGISGGTKMYLSKVAFPALAFGVAYNVPLRLFKSSFSLGMSM